MLYGNGVSYQQQLNARLLPMSISASNSQLVALSQSMNYDSRGNLLSLTDHALPSNSRSNSYDGLNRLISASGPWGSGSFVYDALGNLRSKTLGNRTVSLSYNSLNQLSQSNDSGHSGLRNYSYDSRGNVISAGNLQFNYDETDQPISISGSANGTYSYDAQLKRVKQQVNGNTIYSVYNQAGQLVHIDNLGTQQQTDYLSGPQGSFARISNGVISYLHPDILGSAQSATDANGNLLWQQQYTPFGEELQPVSANHHQAGFTGHISDTDSGLHYMQARYYDPVIGRFYSNDPVDMLGHMQRGNPTMGFNRYAYANNNPYKYTDPDGKFIVQAARTSFQVGWKIGGAINYGIQAATGASLGVLIYNAVHGESDSEISPLNVESGNEPDPADKSGELSRSGRGLQKHGSRPGSAFPKATGNSEEKNRQGQEVLEGIVNDPNSTSKEGNRFGGRDVRSSDGKGARFDQEGTFRGFLEPNQDEPKQQN